MASAAVGLFADRTTVDNMPHSLARQRGMVVQFCAATAESKR